jgi:hypothetical protein
MKKIIFIISVALQISFTAHGAELTLVQTKDVYSGLVTFDVMLDPETDSVNAFSSLVSIPGDMFDVESISTVGSIATLWITQPKVVEETNMLSSLTARTVVAFEGALPGGFDGVRSPYYEGKRPGKLFTITLRPKTKGTGILFFADTKVLLNDGKATESFVTTNTAQIVVPDIKTLPVIAKQKNEPVTYTESPEKTLTASLLKDESVVGSKWAVVIGDDATRHTPRAYRIAESNTSLPENVPFYEWREASSPFILAYQKRNRFIHIQALYTDNTKTTITLAPVENIDDEVILWRILILIGVGMVAIYALQKRHVIRSFFNRPHNNS